MISLKYLWLAFLVFLHCLGIISIVVSFFTGFVSLCGFLVTFAVSLSNKLLDLDDPIDQLMEANMWFLLFTVLSVLLFLIARWVRDITEIDWNPIKK